MLQELSHMDRITQLQDDIQLVTIMSSTIAYLTSRANFVQVQRRDTDHEAAQSREVRYAGANKKELVTDLIVKAKQVEYLIKSLPEPEPEKQILDEMTVANEEYIQAVAPSKYMHAQITGVLRLMFEETETALAEKPPSLSGR
ncbi:Mediator of RNA polymerase II transcription subunit 21 [Mycena venus]|uniref:Mediator of RNA polymerase II transcription subunit 21 n=1 Tax=Mycena venus TaxID=2733690 RepID=A0A8H7CK36_9AGAR|nr:Mediator of RNA polymerase II transcription subunit 21 [Mycena venus]